MKLDDLTGRKFGKLTVIKRAQNTNANNQHVHWLCLCECGNETVVESEHLKTGHTKSCGCYNRDKNKKHGKWKTRLYKTWCNMKSRCNNKNATAYERYGGRGIRVCDEWLYDFESFQRWALDNGYTDGLSIDRINNDGDYCPSNCRWINQREQSNNTSRNHLITYDGETHSISEWADIKGISPKTLWNRIDRGWSVERALTQLVKRAEP